MASEEINLVFNLEGENRYTQAVQNAEKEVSTLKAAMEQLTVVFDGNVNKMEFLQKKQEILTKEQTAYQKSTEAAKEELSRINENFQRQSERLVQLQQELAGAQQNLERMQEAGAETSEEYREQEKTVLALAEAVKKQSLIQQKGLGTIFEWNQKIINSETALEKANKAIRENAKYLEEAENAADQCAKSIDRYGRGVDNSSWLDNIGDKAKKSIQSLPAKGLNLALDTLKNGAQAVKDTMYEASKATAQFAASNGLSEESARRYEEVMKSIKGDNFGEDYYEIQKAMSSVLQAMGDLNNADMKHVTESVITLQDVFGMGYEQSLQRATNLMDGLGISGSEAFDLVTKIAQNDLNRFDELENNLIQNKSLWEAAGFSSGEALALMSNGLDAGAENLGEVNHFVEEFMNSLSSGQIGESIGSFSKETQEMFVKWQDGKASASDVFSSIIGDLDNTTDKQEALTLASKVWAVDSKSDALKVLTSLNDLGSGYETVKGAMDSLQETKQSDLKSVVSGFGNALQEEFVAPIADVALPVVTEFFEMATDAVKGIGEALKPQKTLLEEFVDEIERSNEEVKTSLENSRSITEGAKQDEEKLELYKTKLLELNAIQGKEEIQKFELQKITEELADTIPELAAAYDKTSGCIKLTENEIEHLIDAEKNHIALQAGKEAQIKAWEAMYDAILNEKKIAGAIAEAKKELVTLEEANKNSLRFDSNANFGFGDYYTEMCKMEDEIKRLENEHEEYVKTVEEAEKEYQSTTKAVEEANEEMSQLAEVNENAAASAQDAADAEKELGDAAQMTAEQTAAASEAQKGALEAVQQKYEEFRSQLEADIQNKISLFDSFDGGEDITVETMLENLKSQREGLENWRDNMNILAQEIGGSFTEEFYNELLELGPDAANAVQHMVDTLEQSNGRELLREMCEEWGLGMDLSESIPEAFANTKIAIEAGLRELGSSEADFTTLRETIDVAKASALEGWQSLPEETTVALEETLNAAQEIGIEIPARLTEGIASGEFSAEEAMLQLNAGIQGMFEGLAAYAGEQGISIPEELSAGIANGGQAAVAAYNELIALLLEQAMEAGLAGQTAGDEAVNGTQGSIEAGAPGVAAASSDMVSAGAAAASEKKTEFESAGMEAVTSYGTGIGNGMPRVVEIVRQVAESALSIVLPVPGQWGVAGRSVAEGFANGIRDGISLAVNAVLELADSTLGAGKDRLRINSPSKEFEEAVGKPISKGMAFGIRKNSSLAGKEADKMSAQVLKKGTSWLKKYKKSHEVSLEDEKWYWAQIMKHTKKGTAAYEEANEKFYIAAKGARMENAGFSQKTAEQMAKKINNNFGVSRTTEDGKDKKKKSDKEYYADIYSAAEKYASNQQALNDWSSQQQLAYWVSVKKTLKSGTQAWYDASKKVKDLQDKVAAEEEKAERERIKTHQNVQKDLLNSYKVYYNLSAKAEAEYWDIARKQFKEGTEERIQADQNYLKAQENLYKERKKLDKDYAKNSEDINERLTNGVKDLQDAYRDAVESRKKDILSSMNLFEAWDADGYTADTLIYNLKTQVAGLALWEQQLEELGKKGLAAELMEELRQMGPDAAANIYSLNQMTAEQLDEYNELWKKKGELAQSQALKETEPLWQDTQKQIADLKAGAQAELDALNAEYAASLQELNAGLSEELKNLIKNAENIGEDAVAGLIAGIGREADSVETYNSTLKVVDTITDQLETLEKEGEIVGQDALSGILLGMTDEQRINDACKKLVQSIRDGMEKEAEIHSPSRLFRREIGLQIPAGIAEGMEEGTEAVLRASSSAMQQMLASARAELNRQQTVLQAEAAQMDFSGLARLNHLAEYYPQQETIVNVDNRGILSTMQQMLDGMRGMVDEMKGLQVVMYPDVIAGELQPIMSQENAAAVVRRNRGRYSF